MPTEDARFDEAWRVDWANACLWHQGKQAEAHELLAPIYG
jgi:hypothetical protein